MRDMGANMRYEAAKMRNMGAKMHHPISYYI